MRSIGTRAGVNPALAYHYFENKEALFFGAVRHMMRPPPGGLTVLLQDPKAAGPAIVRLFLTRWEASPDSMGVSGLLRSALTNPNAARILRTLIQEQVTPFLARRSGRAASERRAALVASSLLGLGLARHVLRLPGLSEASIEDVARAVGPTVSRYLTKPLE